MKICYVPTPIPHGECDHCAIKIMPRTLCYSKYLIIVLHSVLDNFLSFMCPLWAHDHS